VHAVQAAVECEDYEMAKRLKADIDKLRSAGEAAAGASHIPSSTYHRGTHPDEIFNRALGRKGNSPTPSVPSHLIHAPGRQGSTISAAHPNVLDGSAATAAGPSHVELDSQPVGPALATAIENAGPESIPLTSSMAGPRIESMAHGQADEAASSDCHPPEGFISSPANVCHAFL
jgi:hypothetical protein